MSNPPACIHQSKLALSGRYTSCIKVTIHMAAILSVTVHTMGCSVSDVVFQTFFYTLSNTTPFTAGNTCKKYYFFIHNLSEPQIFCNHFHHSHTSSDQRASTTHPLYVDVEDRANYYRTIHRNVIEFYHLSFH